MYKVHFLDGIRAGEYEEVAVLEDPWMQIKDGNGQVYNLQDDPRQQLEEYRYSVYSRPVGKFRKTISAGEE
jgi:hypothetical protein